ncbi:hypothetical protein TSTA_100590 [Talaromyces stipitatus ATCC 10500]|uniref:Uncharacterized protein n=1 Tax=Talaromyces stipitatus (strain ATCC 10500 / CBS 375.48 / QM 6759 / NRRL 1006) TaxID=441959 RepID=B8MMQ9_TALSN|nr:uncharacterized protein TSTA_100590 [Talaromyces stipitatus ATCC 10500]EED13815.1 hypothetical protein TSTA_100590 [Talaromyces stipitatus ATCC 10500]
MLFTQCMKHFSKVEIVVANAGIMESQKLFDISDVDEQGELRQSAERFRVIHANIKGTVNTDFVADQWRKSGLKSNTVESVAISIALASVREETGKCCMVHYPQLLPGLSIC